MKVTPASHRLSLRRLAALLVLLGVLVALPTRAAWAKDYSIDSVDIDATVADDGSVSVCETRTFDFDGSFHGVYWKIPKGDYEGRRVGVEIGSVGIVENGAYQEFTKSDSGLDGTYEVTDEPSYVKVKLYSAHEDESASFRIDYTATDLASRWSDTGELYWKFVSDGWDVESRNVTCTIHLPVPAGQSVAAGDNVRAWGHGPLDGSVEFSGNDVVYTAPGVGTDEYAEARVTFPAEWLSAAQPSSEARLDSILSEEAAAAEEANRARATARVVTTVAGVVPMVVSLLTLAYAIWARVLYRRSHRPQFDDKYFRDVPSADHPAVLGALLNAGKPRGEEFTASLMRLTSMHAVDLDVEKVSRKGFLRERTEQDYRLVLRGFPDEASPESFGSAGSVAHEVDVKTLSFVFDKVARWATGEGSRERGASVRFSDFERASRRRPEKYGEAYQDWMDMVSAGCETRGFFVDEGKTHSVALMLLCALDVVLVVATFLLGLWFGSDGLMLVSLVPVVSAVACALLSLGLKSLSREAIELSAKLKALRNWLEDFTRLEEAWPRDVVLWDRLLVMAVVLGVSDKVIEQLRVAAPKMVSELDDYAPSFWWCYHAPGSGPAPLSAFNAVSESAHSVSMAALAKSSDSSSGGGGGGFSSGGGGGFGGGGGGGAF